MNIKIHDLADVKTTKIGRGTSIWQYVVILEGASIGEKCNICSHCFIEDEVLIGNNVTIKNGVQLWNGLSIEDDVFIGPNASFSNDKMPRSKNYINAQKTKICKGASIGAGAVILPGIEIGFKAMIGAGAVVTKSVPPYAIVIGNPSKIIGYLDKENNKLIKNEIDKSNIQINKKVIKCKDVKLYEFSIISDIRGSISVQEFNSNFPFIPKRVFYVFDVPSMETRGEHAHKKCDQFLICIKGGCSVVVDDGINRDEIELNKPGIGLFIPKMTWGIQYRYSNDCVLMVYASDYYDPKDYIRDYDQFIKLIEVK